MTVDHPATGAGGALILVNQDGRAPLHLVVLDRLDVGRECDGLLLADQLVSRLHLRLELVDGRMVVADLGSSNGTFLDGLRVRAPAVLEPFSTVTLGSTSIRLLGAVPLPARPDDDGIEGRTPDDGGDGAPPVDLTAPPDARPVPPHQRETNVSGGWLAGETASTNRR